MMADGQLSFMQVGRESSLPFNHCQSTGLSIAACYWHSELARDMAVLTTMMICLRLKFGSLPLPWIFHVHLGLSGYLTDPITQAVTLTETRLIFDLFIGRQVAGIMEGELVQVAKDSWELRRRRQLQTDLLLKEREVEEIRHGGTLLARYILLRVLYSGTQIYSVSTK